MRNIRTNRLGKTDNSKCKLRKGYFENKCIVSKTHNIEARLIYLNGTQPVALF